MNALKRLSRRAGPAVKKWLRQRWAIFWRACVKYDETDGEQRAASFAYYAFFAIFPLILLLITVGSGFLTSHPVVNPDTGKNETPAETVILTVSKYIPLDPQDSHTFISTVNGFIKSQRSADTIAGVIKSRRVASIIAFSVLAWSAMRFFQALVHGVNRAWGTKEFSWWRLPIKNLFMTGILASALFLGIVTPVVLKQIELFYWAHSRPVGLDFGFVWYLFYVLQLAIPILVLFYGMSMFYKFAPRRRTLFREVWTAALFVTLLVQILQRLFVVYTKNIGNFNALYGTFGSVVALLLWIYLTGSIIILGGCIAAAKYEIEMSLTDQSESNRVRD